MSKYLPILLLVASHGCTNNPQADDAGQRDRDGASDGGDGDGDRVDGALPGGDAGTGRDSGVGERDAGPSDAGREPDAAEVDGYFGDIDTSLRDQALVSALHTKLARDHVRVSYDELYDAYATVDADRGGCADIFDFYSDRCWSPRDACGEYQEEGDCFNREHLWPKSWWGGSESPDQHQDLISVLPTDGFVNNVRGNLPFGEVGAADYTSGNGSRRGSCSVAGAPSDADCFEPTDTLKGDFARIYFYQAVRYEGEFGCCSELAVSGADIKAWQETMLREWHADDPVDAAERERNERVFSLQHTKNPFVELPQLVDHIADF
jgi:endonuclease I